MPAPPDSRDTIVSDHYQGDAGSRYVEHYQTNTEDWGYQLNFEFLEPFLSSQDRVLDFGCGNGGMLPILQRHVRKAEGLEVNPHAAKLARSLGFEVYGSLADLPDTPTYDAVVSNHVLEHVRDVSTTLEHIRASMKPGAKLLLKLPMEDWRAREHRTWEKDDINHHLHTWTPRLIANVLYEAGFEVDDIKVLTSAWHPKLFFLRKFKLDKLAFWAVAAFLKRRQLLVIGHAPVAR